MKPKVFRILALSLRQLLSTQRRQPHSVPNRVSSPEHERERPISDYEMYYWGFTPAPWY